MRKIKFIICLILLFVGGSIFGGELTVIEKKDKYGYADETGKIIIKPQFSRAYPFSNGKAKVCKNGKWGFVNEKGKAIVPIEYDNIEPFEKGIARVKKGNKYGYIKEDGSIYIKPDYNFIGSFNDDGWLWVGKGKTLASAQKGLYHYDKLILKPSAMSNYLGFYIKTDSIDYTNGIPVSTVNNIPENNEIKENFSRLSLSDNSYIWTKALGMVFQIFDLEGKLIVKGQNGAIGMPQNGYSIIRSYSKKKNNQYYHFNYLTTDGKSKKLFKKDIIQELDDNNIFDGCTPFISGYALCNNGKSAYLINTTGSQVSNTYSEIQPIDDNNFIYKQDNLYGFLSYNGNELLRPTYGLIIPSSNGIGVYAAKDPKTEKFGFINIKGETVVPFRFDATRGYADNKAYVSEDGLFGIVDKQGNYIVKNVWQNIVPAKDAESDYIWVQDMADSKWKCLQISNDKLTFDQGFDNADVFDSNGRAIVELDNVFGAVSPTGEIILPIRFSSYPIACKAMNQMDKEGKNSMTETDAYRFNIYNNQKRHKYRIYDKIEDSMWDF